MNRIRQWFVMLMIAWLAATARAWRPAGWTWWDWPWVYEPTTGDWFWFAPDQTQWIHAYPPGSGWALLPQSSLARGWSFWNGDWAYDNDNGAWCWRNMPDTTWCVNMRTGQWSILGRPVVAGTYLVVDLSGGPQAANYPVASLDDVPAGGWTDLHKTDRLLLRRLSAGAFAMGSPTNELGRYDDETQHPVTLTGVFYLGVFEVTQRQWELVMGNRPAFFSREADYPARPVEQVSYHDIREHPDNHAISPTWPVTREVHASSFMGRLRARTGLAAADLPTEAQWEYACRAGTASAINSGGELAQIDVCPNLAAVGRYAFNHDRDETQGSSTNAGTAKVGSYLPNAWGLYDLHGNVWEWCLDWYGANPLPATDPVGAPWEYHRVFRGGSWFQAARECRSARRLRGWPDFRGYEHGFRVAVPVP